MRILIKSRVIWLLITTLMLFVVFACIGCSPGYVIRAGWEEARILWRRKPIAEVLQSKEIDPKVREKLQLVLEAREFAKTLGLTPDGSYTSYSQLDRAVLVWVLSAAPKLELNPYTWWFPIVGSVPYKGFFELEDAKGEAGKLEKKGFDTFVRPSPAFSTLGWFDDPLLSTVLANDEVNLVDTVIHEILHSTIWIPGSVDFNESLANFVGSIGAREFFRARNDLERFRLAEGRWSDELSFATFLNQTTTRLETFYAQAKGDNAESSLAERERIFKEQAAHWKEQIPKLKAAGYVQAGMQLNNAQIIAYKTYLTQPELFERGYQECGSSVKDFLSLIRKVKELVGKDSSDPYLILREQIPNCKMIVANESTPTESTVVEDGTP